jgi:hypothetical protein
VERPIRYLRDSFLYGREFLGDTQLGDEGSQWLEAVANARVHGTTKAVPRDLFEREERAVLQPVADHPYHSLTLSAPPAPPRLAGPPQLRGLPRIDVEQRPLRAYTALVAGGR